MFKQGVIIIKVCPYTVEYIQDELHAERVSKISVAMGSALNLPGDDLLTLKIVGYFHDIGKIEIPDQILNKPGKLTKEEFEIMKNHSLYGEAICRSIGLHEKYLRPIRNHHETLNGKGYPDKLKGDEIDLVTQIITVADAFDALYSDRPYRKKMKIIEIKKIMFEEVEKGALSEQLVKLLFYLYENKQFNLVLMIGGEVRA